MHLHEVLMQAIVLALATCLAGADEQLERYAPKSCKYNPIPSSLRSRAFKAYTGEVRMDDVFGLSSTSKRHTIQMDLSSESLLTMQVELHRDTPATVSVDVYRRGAAGRPENRVITGQNMQGSGGDDTKVFLHGALGEKDLRVDIVFELTAVDMAASQANSHVQESRCHPVRIDLIAVPKERAHLHWPTSCRQEDNLPQSLKYDSVVTLPNEGLRLPPLKDGYYSYRFGDERPVNGFGRVLWNAIIEVPPRMHRFARFFLRASFRFSSAPLQLMLELFDIKETPDAEALVPKCAMGCLGGVPVYNGQIMDHAMPTGFRYRIWLLAASMEEWTKVITKPGRQCAEFDMDYNVTYEEKMTPFEVGPAAWLCESARLPWKLIQHSQPLPTDRLVGQDEVVQGRSIWIRDRFGFPPDETSSMEHEVEISVSERVLFRASTHHSEGVDVFLAMTRKGDFQGERICRSVKHPGPVPRQSVFCLLEPGEYQLTFFADYPLGGLHPCSDFFAQIALRPLEVANREGNKKCIAKSGNLSNLAVVRSYTLVTTPKWEPIRVPVHFEPKPSITSAWMQSFTVSEEDAAKKLYLRLVLQSDYAAADLRFQVRYQTRHIADTQVTAQGYADMIGPLDPGTYKVHLYYVSGQGNYSDPQLCSTSYADMRLISETSYGKISNSSAEWVCTSTRVPPPSILEPQSDEQTLIDSEYAVPDWGMHRISLVLGEARFIRVKTTSSDAEFKIELWSEGSERKKVAAGRDSLEVLVTNGNYTIKFKSAIKGIGMTGTCSTFMLNLMLYPQLLLPVCPWSSDSTDRSDAAEAQKAAQDHVGSVSLDLKPKEVSKDMEVQKPVMFWMSQGMEVKFDFTLDATSAVRIDVSVQPPWLPLEVALTRKRASGKLEAPVAEAEWTESRLLLMESDVPKGTYQLTFLQPRKYTLQSGTVFSEEMLKNLCGHVVIHAEVGVASKEAVNSMRSELLDLPDLLAVQPMPPSLNAVGWFSNSLLSIVGTQVYRFSGATGKSTLVVDEKAILRVVCEPADLSNSDISAVLNDKDGKTVSTSDSLGQLACEVEKGTYELVLSPVASAPFLVTVGLATENRIKEDFALQDSGAKCLDEFPKLDKGVHFSARGWQIGPVFVRLSSKFLMTEGILSTVTVILRTPSVLYIEAGSALPLDLIRIALKVPEGLWIGEQRGMRNSLEIELPPGRYTVQLAQPKPLKATDIKRCLDFSVLISATPVSPDAKSDEKEEAADEASESGAADQSKKQELTQRDKAAVESAPCFGMGLVPLPLDFSDPTGGSRIMGGPIDENGRLLVRTKAMLTDMHNGRKKVYLGTKAGMLTMKVGVMFGGHARFSLFSQLSFAVTPVVDRLNGLEPLEMWSSPVGWERIYTLDATKAGFWLAFHHGHRESSESACFHFGLEIEIHPQSDTQKMQECPSETRQPEDVFPRNLEVPLDEKSDKLFRYAQGKNLFFVKERQVGFLTKTKFTLKTEAFLSVEVGYNFYSSHAEMDLVSAEDENTHKAIVSAEQDYRNGAHQQLNTHLVIGQTMPPGDYVLRVADDHYAGQLGDGEGCFPFSFEFRAVPKGAAPTIVSIQPHPSVPITKGVDFVLTIRFSEPPKGSVPEVVSKISLGGFQAVLGGSMEHMESKYSTKKTTTVQASAGEGHLVWVIGFSAKILANVRHAKLKVTALRSNTTGAFFRFNSPTFFIVEAPPRTPWKGGSPQGEKEHEDLMEEYVVDTKKKSAESAKSSSSSGNADSAPKVQRDAGEINTEGSRRRSSSSSDSIGEIGGGKPVPDAPEEDDDSHEPKVINDDSGGGGAWNPMDDDDSPKVKKSPSLSQKDSSESETKSADAPAPPPPPPPESSSSESNYNPMDSASDECPEGSVKNADTGACEDAGSSVMGSRTVYIGCGIVLAVFGVAYYYPGSRKASGNERDRERRFRDIGDRTSAEEVGLVQYGARFDDEDDML